MKNIIIILIFAIMSMVINASDKKYYEGTINEKYKIVMILNFEENIVKGKYYYRKTEKPIEINGKKDNNSITLTEYIDNNENAKFEGTIKENIITGTWENGKKIYSFNLSENKVMSNKINIKLLNEEEMTDDKEFISELKKLYNEPNVSKIIESEPAKFEVGKFNQKNPAIKTIYSSDIGEDGENKRNKECEKVKSIFVKNGYPNEVYLKFKKKKGNEYIACYWSMNLDTPSIYKVNIKENSVKQIAYGDASLQEECNIITDKSKNKFWLVGATKMKWGIFEMFYSLISLNTFTGKQIMYYREDQSGENIDTTPEGYQNYKIVDKNKDGVKDIVFYNENETNEVIYFAKKEGFEK